LLFIYVLPIFQLSYPSIIIYVLNLHKGDQLCHHLIQMTVKISTVNTILHSIIICAILSHCCQNMVLGSCNSSFSCLLIFATSRVSSLLGSFLYFSFYFILLNFITKIVIIYVYQMSSMMSMCCPALPAPVLPCNCLLKPDPS
jgi:hypothetical protein